MFLDVRHLQTLTAIRDCGGVARAAERLHLTQPALSHQLKVLEERCGGSLFVRRSRPLVFTALGRHLLAVAERVLQELDRAERECKRIAGGRAGRLYIAIDCHSCVDWLLPSMDAYRERWPDVELDLSLAHSFGPLPALLEGNVDLVITSDPEENVRIRYSSLFRYESLLIVASGHALSNRRRIEPGHLAPETLITYPVSEQRLDVFRTFLNPAGVRPAGRRTAEMTSVIVQLVASGRGVAVLPSWAVGKYLEAGYVSGCRLGTRGLWATLHAGCRCEEAEAAYVRGFVEQARAVSATTLQNIRLARRRRRR